MSVPPFFAFWEARKKDGRKKGDSPLSTKLVARTSRSVLKLKMIHGNTSAIRPHGKIFVTHY